MDDSIFPTWLGQWMATYDISLWGAADLKEFNTPVDETGEPYPRAISMVFPMNSKIMASIQNGPNKPYADEYQRVNDRINEVSQALAAELNSREYPSQPLAASNRTDTVNIKGDFPQKTAATRAGLGWIGRHCQLITRPFGSWVRLGTVFTHMELPCGPPMDKGYCGRCRICVEACPAGALKGASWSAGMERHEIIDVKTCDMWKKENYFEFHKGHNCGICSAVCPHGLKLVKETKS